MGWRGKSIARRVTAKRMIAEVGSTARARRGRRSKASTRVHDEEGLPPELAKAAREFDESRQIEMTATGACPGTLAAWPEHSKPVAVALENRNGKTRNVDLEAVRPPSAA